MQYKNTFRLKMMAAMIASTFGTPCLAVAEEAATDEAQSSAARIQLKQIDVIGTTPLAGIGLPLEQVPANVQSAKGEELTKQKSLSVADYMSQNLVGVNVNDNQNNPYQPDVQFRGYSASPLLGTPQGLSVFYDGVRVNEPFGDVVNWDLIPVNALAGISLIPGSNPVFGLNTLGGALSIQTKSGLTHPGGAVEVYTGSWGRRAGSAEYGGAMDNGVDYFISANSFREDGWRDFSPSDVRQLFAKVGWQNETTAVNLSFTGADNDLIGNGLAPADLLRTSGRDSILTRPDQTKNTLAFFNLNGSHWFTEETMFSGNLYYRDAKTTTLNGDGNDDLENFDPDMCVPGADPEEAEEACSGALNRSSSKRIGYGFTGQLAFNQDLLQRSNQLIVGMGYEYGRTKFNQNTEFGLVNATRGIDGIGVMNELDEQVILRGKNETWSLYATDTLSLDDHWHLTLSGRYNRTKIDNKDGITPVPDPDPAANESLTGTHRFNRFNPAIGLNYTPRESLTIYGTYNEGSRAPTAIELGCANEFQPCKLPNAFAGDPPLDQVVAKTYEVGMRGLFDNGIGWSTAAYRTRNTNDILFVASNSTGEGYFKNFGETRRQGLEASLFGELSKFRWSVGYSLVHATYQSEESLVSETNTSADAEGQIQIRPGDRIPGIPLHQLKLRGELAVTPNWSVGSNVLAFSDQYSRGNENNRHQGAGAKVSGYAVVNLDTRYNLGGGWQLFAKLNNVFDREYNNAGLLGESLFNADGTFAGGEESTQAFYAPGAPRAGWFGVRWEFGGAKSSQVDLD